MSRYINTILKACPEGKRWAIKANIRSDAEAWKKLHRPDWMMLIVKERGIKLNEKKLRHFAADCAEAVLPIFEKNHPGDSRPRRAIQAARDCAVGKIGIDDMSVARLGAIVASAKATLGSTTATGAVAWAAFSATMDDAIDAACAVAWSSISAAIESASSKDALEATMLKQAKRLRKYFPNPFKGKS
jgi:hypothetical protein